jgi:outer membrane lipoprotein SlyB
MKIISQLLVLLCSVSLLVGCASRSQSAKVYTQDQAKMSHSVVLGTVTRIEAVTIEGSKSGVGTVGGGVAGGVLGSMVGGGKGSILMAVGGAVAGAVGGSLAEEKITEKNALEIEVQLDTGGIQLVVQEPDEEFAIGDRVRIVKGADGSSRVRH